MDFWRSKIYVIKPGFYLSRPLKLVIIAFEPTMRSFLSEAKIPRPITRSKRWHLFLGLKIHNFRENKDISSDFHLSGFSRHFQRKVYNLLFSITS